MDAYSEMIPWSAWNRLQPQTIDGLSNFSKKRMQKMLSKDLELKNIANEEEFSTISNIFDLNGDSMTARPSAIRWKLFDEDMISVTSKASLTS